MTDHTTPQPIAIDPPGCGCTECLTGEYVPLDRATPDHIAALLGGVLRNHLNTGTELHLTVTHTLTAPHNVLTVQSARVAYHDEYRDDYRRLSWDLHPAQLPSH